MRFSSYKWYSAFRTVVQIFGPDECVMKLTKEPEQSSGAGEDR